MNIAYRFRIYPNKEQAILMQKTFGCVRYVYNHFLARRKEAYEKDKTTLDPFACSRELTVLKKETEWLKEPDKNALIYTLRDLDSAYKNFFDRIKRGETQVGYPKFKSKKDNRKKYKTQAEGIHIFDKYIQLPKLGKVRCKFSRKVEGEIVNATISQEPSGKYYVSICCEDVEIKQYASTGKTVGIDLGVKDLIITSYGDKYINKKFLRKSERRLKHLQRNLSRKTSGSKRYVKARIAAAKVHERIRNCRTDYLQKLTTELVKNYDVIYMEDLNAKGMTKNHRLAKSINDVAFNEIACMLKYKTEWQHHKLPLQKIDRFFPSSQMCHKCGYINKAVKNPKIREWVCPECGEKHDRDINAAINILNKGTRQFLAAK